MLVHKTDTPKALPGSFFKLNSKCLHHHVFLYKSGVGGGDIYFFFFSDCFCFAKGLKDSLLNGKQVHCIIKITNEVHLFLINNNQLQNLRTAINQKTHLFNSLDLSSLWSIQGNFLIFPCLDCVWAWAFNSTSYSRCIHNPLRKWAYYHDKKNSPGSHTSTK